MDEERPRWPGRAVLHVDMDAFFAAVEQLDNPEWRGKPVIVGGTPDGRGVVSTCSYEAREFGVHSAQPAARAAKLCPDAIWAWPRFTRYKEISDAVMEIFRSVSPGVQQISIDEAYVDVTPGVAEYRDPVDVAIEIQARVAQLGVTCSAGLAASKTVAKIASDFKKPAGLTVVRPGEEREFLAPLPIRALPGIGPKSAQRLNAVGIKTLGQIAELDDQDAAAVFGPHGVSVVARAQGLDFRPVRKNEPVKSVSNEMTFDTDAHDAEKVIGTLERLAEKVGGRLRKKSLTGRTINVKLRYADFTTRTAQRTLDSPTDRDDIIRKEAASLARTLWSEGIGVRLIGVGVSHFDIQTDQLDLLESVDESEADERMAELIKSMDRVKERFGDQAIRRGARPSRERDHKIPESAPVPRRETDG